MYVYMYMGGGGYFPSVIHNNELFTISCVHLSAQRLLNS